jgi:hypothetical protein
MGRAQGPAGRHRAEIGPSREAERSSRQLFDDVSGTYTYLLARRRGREAMILDRVIGQIDRYLQLIASPPRGVCRAASTPGRRRAAR